MSHRSSGIKLTFEGIQGVVEVTSSLERQRVGSEEDPVKEASQQTSWYFDHHLSPERDTKCDLTYTVSG